MGGSNDPWPFVASGPYPARAGNRVRPWIDGEPAFDRICRAIAAARHSVWATVTFLWPTFQMPGGRGSALAVLEEAAARGVDVRLVFWRPDDETAGLRANAFWGTAEHRALLARCHPHLKVRWDRALPGYCQHQKSWLVDAGGTGGLGFVGGINLNPHSVVAPGHAGAGHNHDAYVELAGPALVDVHHNFVQRWNEASERGADDGRWGDGSDDELPYPDTVPVACGVVEVQVQRTMPAGRYRDQPAFAFSAGERTNLDQYRAAIAAARRTIYLENQQLDVPELLAALADALDRGVEIVVVAPVPPSTASWTPHALEDRVGAHPGLSLCGLAGLGPDGRRHPVHVHAKLMLVDDTWATVGSCNLHRYSLHGNAELNLAFRDPASVRALRSELFGEHLATDTTALDDLAALRLFRQVARDNRDRHRRGATDWQGLAIDLGAPAPHLP